MPDDSAVALAWVVTAEGLSSVASFRVGPRPRNTRENPRVVRCPVCDQPVTLKLGNVRAPHAAHAADTRCPTTHSETALHVNVKYRLYEQLHAAAGTGATIRVRERCVVGAWRGPGATRRVDAPPPDLLAWELEAEPCHRSREREWRIGWDHVELERRIGDESTARIPDLVLSLAGRTVGAIEVFHTHAVDAVKAAALAALGVPWLEVRADPALVEGDRAWTIDAPLIAHRLGPDDPWRCPKHARWYARDLAEQRRVRESGRFEARLRGIRFVDFYAPSGHLVRRVYRLLEQLTDGVPVAISIEHEKGTIHSHRLTSGRDAAAAALKRAFRRDVRLTAERLGAIADSPMRWAAGEAADALLAESRRPVRYLRRTRGVPCASTHPPRYVYLAQERSWRLPPEHDIRWDRAGDDLGFAAPDRFPDARTPRRISRTSTERLE